MIKYGGKQFKNIQAACNYMMIDFYELKRYMDIKNISDYEDGLREYIKDNFIFSKGLLFRNLEAACNYNHVDVNEIRKLLNMGYGFDLAVQMAKRGMNKI